MKPVNLILSVCWLCVTQTSLAVEWETIIQKPNVVIAVDIDSYTQVGSYAQMASRYTYANPQTKETPAYVSKHIEAQFDCKKQQIRITKTQLLAPQTPKQFAVLKPAESGFRPLNASESEDQIASLVCQVQKMVGGQ